MFITDSRTENFLTSVGAKWHYANELSFDKLASRWDTINLGRSEVKVAGAVEEYGLLMERGSAAPAPILWKPQDSDGFQVLDGVQRLLAEELRKPTSFSAYIADLDSDSMAAKIRVFSNYRLQGGYQESAEWTLEQAIVLLVNKGVLNIEEVAGFGGWSPATVRDKAQIIGLRQSIVGVGGPDRVPDSILRLVSKHAHRGDFAAAPECLADFFNDVKRMRLSAAEAEPHIEEFFSLARSKGKLHGQFKQKLDDFHNDEEVRTRLADPTRLTYQPMTPDGRLVKALKAALTTSERIRDAKEKITELPACFQIAGQTRKVLQQIERMRRTR